MFSFNQGQSAHRRNVGSLLGEEAWLASASLDPGPPCLIHLHLYCGHCPCLAMTDLGLDSHTAKGNSRSPFLPTPSPECHPEAQHTLFHSLTFSSRFAKRIPLLMTIPSFCFSQPLRNRPYILSFPRAVSGGWKGKK